MVNDGRRVDFKIPMSPVVIWNSGRVAWKPDGLLSEMGDLLSTKGLGTSIIAEMLIQIVGMWSCKISNVDVLELLRCQFETQMAEVDVKVM